MKHLILTLLLTLTLLTGRSQELLPFRQDSLWGYKDRQGMVKIKPQFEFATKFRMNSAIVGRSGRFGAIDKNTNQLIPCQYEFLRQLDTTEFLFGYRGKYVGDHIMGVMTRDEKIKIPVEYSSISKYKNTYTVEKSNDSIIGKSAFGDLRTGWPVVGLLDSNGKVLLPCRYDYIGWINDSLLDVATGRAVRTHALFTSKGKQLTAFIFAVVGPFIEGMAKAKVVDKFGFISPNGKIVIPISFDYCEDFNNGYAMIQQQNCWGAINKNGNIVIVPKFSYQEAKAILKEKY